MIVELLMLVQNIKCSKSFDDRAVKNLHKSVLAIKGS
jgi:hypothetical protein